MKNIKSSIKDFTTKLDSDIVSVCLVFLCVFAVFCHYVVTNIILFSCAGLLLFVKGSIKKIFLHRSSYIAMLFLLLTFITGIYYKNYKGLTLSLTFLAIAIIGFYLRSVMTAPLFEWMLNLILFACIVVFVGCTIAKIINIDVPKYRCTLWFGNCNYLGALMAGCITICGYKEITKQGRPIFNYLLALGCAVCMFFTGSLFAVVEMFIGIFVLLVLAKKHRLLSIFLLVCAIGCVILYAFPDIYPRLGDSMNTTDNRILVWQGAIAHLRESIIFGKGFFTYRMLSNVPYPSSHTHNFVIDSVLSYGIVGSSLLGLFFFAYYRITFLCNQMLRKSIINILILALSAGVLIHATTDMTMLWSQTGLFYALILSGIGADERKLALLRYRYYH